MLSYEERVEFFPIPGALRYHFRDYENLKFKLDGRFSVTSQFNRTS
jgi:hypothetical protein